MSSQQVKTDSDNVAEPSEVVRMTSKQKRNVKNTSTRSRNQRTQRSRALKVSEGRSAEKEVAKTANRGLSDKETDLIVNFVFDMVVKVAMKKFEDVNIDPHNISEFTARLMELVEDFPIKGAEKKRVVLKILEKFTDREAELIDDDNEEEIDRVEQIRFILIEVLPFTIDTLVAVSKNEIVIDAVKKTKKWCKGLKCCGGSVDSKDDLKKLIDEHVNANLSEDQ